MAKVTHGLTRNGKTSPEYSAFIMARKRCRNPKDPGYADYGGRGIEFRFSTIEEWMAEVGMKPSPQHSIDRINNDGHYEKGNLRWATRSQQARNTRPHRVNGPDNPMYGKQRPDLAAWNKAHRTGVTPKPLSADARKIISDAKKKYWDGWREQNKDRIKVSPCPQNAIRHRYIEGACIHCGLEKACA